MRKVASSPAEAPVPARACTEGGAAARGAPAPKAPSSAAQHSAAAPAQATCASRAGLVRGGGDLDHTPSRHAAAPPLPVAPTARLGPSARRRAKLQESWLLPSAVQVS